MKASKTGDLCLPIKCAVCKRCCMRPDWPGRCVFGGPFDGYQETKTNAD